MRAIVIGGGIAGTTCAIALRRIGAEVTVHEAYADAAGEVGSFLSLASNGLRALDALDCGDAVRAAGFPVPDLRLCSASGKVLGQVPRGRRASDPSPSVTVMRGRLVETLRERASHAGARIGTGRRLTGLDQEADRVRARFADGTTDEADLLVGADGLWSVTRGALDGRAPRPRYCGLYTVSGISGARSARSAPGGLEPGVFTMTFGRRGAFLDVPAPDGTVWWSAQVAAPEPPAARSRLPEVLRELYAGEDRASAILRDAVRVDRPTPMHTLADVPVRYGDRVVLVGDALHPVGAGQGAGMAVEDAVVLARALARGGADSPREALAAYDRERRPRLLRMAKAAGGNRDAKSGGPLRRRVQDLVMPLALRHFHARATDWLYTYDVGTVPSATAFSARLDGTA
ncbi:FAD-dependent monooxygenase [Streptomyces sp. PTM05]|uniref:FAD-dependent monooxygenase n=1 Tax=Streptantibioticus parmotrematis TaxID=2873249 RepID=A0ABS7QUN8_9ACTN|nr:FAD-dependent monooxygenase [Streptantibioticus parmotrematis]MBY8886916.1 FAD-dependent monooxygenase [Streptantibioticus parmotrematis]